MRFFFVQFGELNNLAPYLSIFSNQLECACYNFLSSKLIYYGILPFCNKLFIFCQHVRSEPKTGNKLLFFHTQKTLNTLSNTKFICIIIPQPSSGRSWGFCMDTILKLKYYILIIILIGQLNRAQH